MGAASGTGTFGCAACFEDVATAVWDKRSALVRGAILADEPHFIVSLLGCAACAQTFVSVFCESIDFTGGNDPQDWLVIPVTTDEAIALTGAGTNGVERALGTLGERRYLVRWFPSDAAKPEVRFITGRVRLPLHE